MKGNVNKIDLDVISKFDFRINGNKLVNILLIWVTLTATTIANIVRKST